MTTLSQSARARSSTIRPFAAPDTAARPTLGRACAGPSAFLLGENGKVRRDEDFVFYNQLISLDYSTETAMIFGEVYRHRGEWKFKAVGQGFSGGLEALCHQFGVAVA